MAEVELEADKRWQELGKTVGSLRAIVHALAAAAADDLIEKTQLHALDGQGQTACRSCADALDEAELIAEECATPSQGEAVIALVEGRAKEIVALKAELAAAKLACSRTLAARPKQQRDALLRGTTLRKRKPGTPLTEEERLAVQTKGTSTLKQMQESMAAEIERTTAELEVFDSSTETMRAVASKHEGVGAGINRGSKLMKVLSDREKRDRQIVCAALVVFCTTVMYVVGKRLHMIPVAIGRLIVKVVIGVPMLIGVVYLCCCGLPRR